MANKRTIDEAHLALGEPIAIDFSDYTRKIRNNLIVVSVISTILTTQNVLLDPTSSSLLGLKFSNIDQNLILKILFFITIYFLIHFVWVAWDHFLAWELRLTGSHKKFKGPYTDGISDTEPDPSQTTLYFWWKNQSQRMNNHQKSLGAIAEKTEALHTHAISNWSHSDTLQAITELKGEVKKLNTSMLTADETIKDIRIPASLERFDNHFHYFNNSQSWRWFWIELMLPVIIGIIAVGELWFKAWA